MLKMQPVERRYDGEARYAKNNVMPVNYQGSDQAKNESGSQLNRLAVVGKAVAGLFPRIVSPSSKRILG